MTTLPQIADNHDYLVLCSGRRDDLWSWLYVLVEMLAGTLPWRRSTADRGATQRTKEECVANPERLCSQILMPGTPPTGPLLWQPGPETTTSNTITCCSSPCQKVLSHCCAYAAGPLVTISNHLEGLGFEDAPDYNFLHACLDRLSNEPAALATSVSAGSLMGSLEDDYPLPAPTYSLPAASALPARAALASSVQPGSQARTHTPDSIPSFAMSEPMNGHHRADGGAALRGHAIGAGFGIGMYSGDMNGRAQPVFIADTPRSPPEETDLLYGDLLGVSDAPPPLPAGPPPALLPSPFIAMPKAMPVAQSATLSSQAAPNGASRPGQSRRQLHLCLITNAQSCRPCTLCFLCTASLPACQCILPTCRGITSHDLFAEVDQRGTPCSAIQPAVLVRRIHLHANLRVRCLPSFVLTRFDGDRHKRWLPHELCTHHRPRDGAATVRQHEQGSRGTSSPAQRQHERSEAGRNAEGLSHKRRGSPRGERDGAADDRWRPPEKRRDIDGDTTRRDIQRDHSRDEDRCDRQRDSRRRGDTRNAEQPKWPSSSSHLAPGHAPEGSRIRDMVDNVRKVSAN